MVFRATLLASCLAFAQQAQAAPALGAAHAGQERGAKVQSNEFNLEGEEQFARWANGDHSIEARAKGRIEFNDDDSDVKSISRGGHLRIKEERGGVVRSLEVVPGPDGAPQKSYTARGQRREFDAEARAWLSSVLPLVIRHTAVAADTRVQRILARGGADAVLDEISRVETNSAKLIYLRQLFKARLSADDLQRAARLVARTVSSDGDKARFLVESLGSYLGGEAAPASFFEAVNSIRADGDRRRVLAAVAGTKGLSRANLLRTFESAKGMASDGDKAGFLAGVDPRELGDAGVAAAFFEAVDSIRADGDRRRVLSTLLGGRGLSRENLLRTLRSAARMSSDGDKAGFLLEVAHAGPQDASVRAALREAARGISSEGDRQRVLAALAQE
ncbi:MAG TPA: hypothetical protein VF611_03485 [Pyrinomonadaceae bacterium]|jgi:hypothetical protein